MTVEETLAEILARLTAIEAELSGTVKPVPVPTGGAYQFVRTFDSYGKGTKVETADEAENVKRACASINWNGDTVYDPGPYLDEVWAEIGKLQNADPALMPYYQTLDPAMACFGLLMGQFDTQRLDTLSFGINHQKRLSCDGGTISAFVQAQIDKRGDPGGPSGQ